MDCSIKGRMLALLLVAITVPRGTLAGDSDKRPTAAYQRAKAELVCRQYQKAAKAFDDAIRSGNRETGVYRGRAFARLLSGDPEGAIADFRAAALADPRSAALYYGRGAAYRMLGLTEKAIADFSHAIEVDPNYTTAYGERGEVFLNAGNVQAGTSDIGRYTADLAARNYVREDGTDLVAGRRVDLNNFFAYPCWVLLFEEMRAAGPRGARVPGAGERTKYAALWYATSGQVDKALEIINAVIQTEPRDATAYRLRGALQGCRGDPLAAQKDLKRARELDPNDFASSRLSSGTHMEIVEKVERGEYNPRDLIHNPDLLKALQELEGDKKSGK